MRIARLADVVKRHAAERPDAVALTFEGRRTTYGLLDYRANQVANGLIAAGLRPEARIALFDKNHDSFFEIWFAAAKVGVVLVPVNWRLAAPEVAFIINDAAAEMLFVGPEFLDTIEKIRDQLRMVREVIVLDQAYTAWRDQQPATDPDLPVAGHDVCMQMYTSGTTG